MVDTGAPVCSTRPHESPFLRAENRVCRRMGLSRYNPSMEPSLSSAVVEQEIRNAVEFLSRWPGVRRVWLFGSAAKGRRLDWRSDLDFAVEGMDSTTQYRAWSELDERMKIPCDLVLYESADALLRTEISRSGKLLYEA